MVEDEASDAQLAEHVLRRGGFEFVFKRVDSQEAFARELKEFRPSVILSDHGMCAFDGFSALALAQNACPDVPFIFVTGSLGEEMATKALKNGATDFILKHRMAALPPAVHRALREAHSRIQRRKAEQQIRRLNEELEHRVVRRTAELEAANKELEAFSYSVSHELRAPLRQIEGFVEVLNSKGGTALDDESRQYLATIGSAARHLSQLVDDLLAFSRTARAGMRKKRSNLATICESALRDFSLETEGRKVEWVIDDLPEASCDPALLRQVFVNLISNALKYTRRNQHARIEIRGRMTEEELIVSVKDNGVGFDMRFARRLFGVFQRLHSRSEFEGTGVGLANVRRIINQHGGRTWAEAKPNAGATFYFSLPIKEETGVQGA
jgi:light-regulated signal transduction histidine kinase (bacteriophytochrome)